MKTLVILALLGVALAAAYPQVEERAAGHVEERALSDDVNFDDWIRRWGRSIHPEDRKPPSGRKRKGVGRSIQPEDRKRKTKCKGCGR